MEELPDHSSHGQRTVKERSAKRNQTVRFGIGSIGIEGQSNRS